MEYWIRGYLTLPPSQSSHPSLPSAPHRYYHTYRVARNLPHRTSSLAVHRRVFSLVVCHPPASFISASHILLLSLFRHRRYLRRSDNCILHAAFVLDGSCHSRVRVVVISEDGKSNGNDAARKRERTSKPAKFRARGPFPVLRLSVDTAPW